jgi:hypothetical protein
LLGSIGEGSEGASQSCGSEGAGHGAEKLMSDAMQVMTDAMSMMSHGGLPS